MRIFKDKSLEQEIKTLDLGIVLAGKIKRFEFYILNDSDAELIELKFSVVHKEVEVIESPEKLDPHKSASLILEWRPSITLKEGLKTELKVSGKELWK